MKLSEFIELYDFSIIKDTNGNFYLRDNMDYFRNYKQYASVGNTVLGVVDAIPESLIKETIDDILENKISEETLMKCKETGLENEGTVESTLKILEYAKDNKIEDDIIGWEIDYLKSIYECSFEDDIKPQFITEEIFKDNPYFEFNFTDIGQGYSYKANYDCEWKDIPDNAIIYIPESSVKWDAIANSEYATEVYTKKDLEELVKKSNYEMGAACLLETLTYENPKDFLNEQDYDFLEK